MQNHTADIGQHPDSNEENTSASTHGVVVDRIPAWATSVERDPDGYVVFSRVVREDLEVQQCANLMVDQEEGTVIYEKMNGLLLSVPGIDDVIGVGRARTILSDLTAVLAVVDEIQAAGE